MLDPFQTTEQVNGIAIKNLKNYGEQQTQSEKTVEA